MIVRSEISDLEMQPFQLLFGVELGLLRSCRVKNLDFKLYKIIKIGKYDLRVLIMVDSASIEANLRPY